MIWNHFPRFGHIYSFADYSKYIRTYIINHAISEIVKGGFPIINNCMVANNMILLFFKVNLILMHYKITLRPIKFSTILMLTHTHTHAHTHLHTCTHIYVPYDKFLYYYYQPSVHVLLNNINPISYLQDVHLLASKADK